MSVSDLPESTAPALVAMLGGTFDPIHHGHLRTAVEIRERLQADQVRLIPCHRPPHRDRPQTGAQHRLAMVQQAVAHEPGLVVDDRELRSERPSYSIDTLCSLRQELGDDCSLVMVIGTDSLLGLQQWHRWEALLDQAHIVVVSRPGWEMPDQHPLGVWLQQHQALSVDELQRLPQGRVMAMELTPLAISATQIRALRASGRSPRYLTPDSVLAYMAQHRLYCESQD